MGSLGMPLEHLALEFTLFTLFGAEVPGNLCPDRQVGEEKRVSILKSWNPQ